MDTPAHWPPTFGGRLLEAIHDQGGPTAQQKASEWLKARFGITLSGPMINKYKKGPAAARIEKCRELAEALDVTVEWLYTGRGPKRAPERLSDDEQEVIELLRQLSLKMRKDWIGHLRIEVRRQLKRARTATSRRESA